MSGPEIDLTTLRKIADQFKPVDWRAAWDAQPDEVQWLIEPIIEVGQSVALYAAPGTGKSLISLEWAAGLATGHAVLGNLARDPVTVLYVDVENRQVDLVERLQAFGYKPADLGRLVTISFPWLAALDSAHGGRQILALAVTHGAAIVIIDTTSRVVTGPENDADTYLALYSHTVMPLRGRGIAMLRLDHPGKDITRGARGSSAKKGDVDSEWLLTEITKTEFALKRQKSRSNHGDGELRLRRRFEPLRHEPLPGGVSASPDRVGEIVAALDRLDVPITTGRTRARKALKNAGIRAANAHLEDALKIRKNLPGANLLPGLEDLP
jgi:RecA-family ATPase